MGYDSQVCLDRMRICGNRLSKLLQLRDRVEEQITISLRKLDCYRGDVRYFTGVVPDQDMRVVSEAFFSDESANLRRLFSLRNHYFGAIRNAEHEKTALEATYFDRLAL